MQLTRRDVLFSLLGLAAMGPRQHREQITVVLHLDPRLVEECRIAQASRNNISLEEWITETIANAVSDCSVLPGGCKKIGASVLLGMPHESKG